MADIVCADCGKDHSDKNWDSLGDYMEAECEDCGGNLIDK